MGYLFAALAIVLFLAYFLIKNARGSAERGNGPDINDPASAPDNIGERGSQSAHEDGDGDGE